METTRRDVPKKSIGTRFEITDGRFYCSFNISQNIEILEEAGGYDQSLNLTRDKKSGPVHNLKSRIQDFLFRIPIFFILKYRNLKSKCQYSKNFYNEKIWKIVAPSQQLYTSCHNRRFYRTAPHYVVEPSFHHQKKI